VYQFGDWGHLRDGPWLRGHSRTHMLVWTHIVAHATQNGARPVMAEQKRTALASARLDTVGKCREES
jgi:hypothetical protein